MSKANAVVEEPTLQMIVGIMQERGRNAVAALEALARAAEVWMEEPAATNLLDMEDL